VLEQMKIRPAQGGIRSDCDRVALSLDATPPLLGVRLNERLEHEHLEHDCGLTVFRHACKMGLGGNCLEAAGIALQVWAFSRLAQVQEPRGARGEAGGGGRLEEGKDRSDMKKYHAAVAAVAIGALMFVLPADARPKKQKRPEMQKRYEVQTQTPSLDGRTLGRMRTCGFDYLQYDGLGTPYGPYCH
jgi:hypothetical protein